MKKGWLSLWRNAWLRSRLMTRQGYRRLSGRLCRHPSRPGCRRLSRHVSRVPTRPLLRRMRRGKSRVMIRSLIRLLIQTMIQVLRRRWRRSDSRIKRRGLRRIKCRIGCRLRRRFLAAARKHADLVREIGGLGQAQASVRGFLERIENGASGFGFGFGHGVPRCDQSGLPRIRRSSAASSR